MENGFVDLPPELMPTFDELPGDLKDIAEVIGIENTMKMVNRFRGSHVYIRNIDHLIRGKRNAEIIKKYDAGVRVADLARAYRLSTRQIESILSKG